MTLLIGYSLTECSNSTSQSNLKVTYHENLTFPGFKCYNQVPGASTNQGNVKKINPVTLFWYAFFCKPLKKRAHLISLP